MKWQPIETAPKDGHYLLLLNKTEYGGEVAMAWFSAPENIWVRCHSNDAVRRATHWMPIPEPPDA